MGILNVTPDSFSDGGQYLDVARAVARATEMADEGACLIDIGGASSRPKGSAYGTGAELVPADQELGRILPVVSEVARLLPDIWISVDTFRSDVARAVLEAGAHMINDITALRFDPDVAAVCAEFNAPLVLMHSVGMPGEMPQEATYGDVVERVREDLRAATLVAEKAGCSQLLLDPGFGFGKSVSDNLLLIRELNQLGELGWPVLIGVSRKNTLGRIISRGGDIPPPPERLFSGLGVTAVGVEAGASIVRTHDVRETVEFLTAFSATRNR